MRLNRLQALFLGGLSQPLCLIFSACLLPVLIEVLAVFTEPSLVALLLHGLGAEEFILGCKVRLVLLIFRVGRL